MNVKNIMIKDIVTIGIDNTVLDACNMFDSNKIGCLLVMKDGAMVGIITERDIISRVIVNQKNPNQIKIRDVMSRNIITIRSTDNVKEAIEVMNNNKIKKLPVVSYGDTLEGIITITDIVKIMPNSFKILEDCKSKESFRIKV